MDWISKRINDVLNMSPFKASQDSLKRKRSLTPQPNSREEIVEDSEEERQERRARGTEYRRIRQRTIGHQPSTGQNGRAPLSFKAVSQYREARKGTVITAPDEDELDMFANGSFAGVGDDEYPVAAQNEWSAERQGYKGTIERLRCEVRDQQDEIHRMRAEIDDSSQRYSEMERNGERMRLRAREAEGRHDSLQAELQELQRRCADAEDRLEKNKGLLQARTEELNVAQTFMTTADQYSVAELSRAVQELNDDIYQIAMSLSDTLLDQKQGEPPNDAVTGADIDSARTSLMKRYGEETISRVVSDLAQDDTILFECLIQNVLVSRCSVLIQSICPTDPAVNKALRSVWGQLSTACEPAIAKNWLALTSSQFKSSEVELASTANAIACLMAVAGWRKEEPSAPTLPQGALEKLSQIQVKALRVREMAAEGILSTIVEAFCIPTKRPFSATHMTDAYDSGKSTASAGKDNVVCQTGIGLRCVTRIAPPSGRTEAQRKVDIVLKAKVLLSSTLLPPP